MDCLSGHAHDFCVLHVAEKLKPPTLLTKIDRRRSVKIRGYYCGFVDLEVVGSHRRNGCVADEQASIHVILNKLKKYSQ